MRSFKTKLISIGALLFFSHDGFSQTSTVTVSCPTSISVTCENNSCSSLEMPEVQGGKWTSRFSSYPSLTKEPISMHSSSTAAAAFFNTTSGNSPSFFCYYSYTPNSNKQRVDDVIRFVLRAQDGYTFSFDQGQIGPRIFWTWDVNPAGGRCTLNYFVAGAPCCPVQVTISTSTQTAA